MSCYVDLTLMSFTPITVNVKNEDPYVFPYSSSKHSGVLLYFNRHFIKSGIIPKDIGRAVNKAFDIRQRGDYREQISLEPYQVEPFIDWADKLIESVRDLLKSCGHI